MLGGCAFRSLDVAKSLSSSGKIIFISSPPTDRLNSTRCRTMNTLITNKVLLKPNRTLWKTKVHNLELQFYRTAKTARKEIVEQREGQQGAVTIGEKGT